MLESEGNAQPYYIFSNMDSTITFNIPVTVGGAGQPGIIPSWENIDGSPRSFEDLVSQGHIIVEGYSLESDYMDEGSESVFRELDEANYDPVLFEEGKNYNSPH